MTLARAATEYMAESALPTTRARRAGVSGTFPLAMGAVRASRNQTEPCIDEVHFRKFLHEHVESPYTGKVAIASRRDATICEASESHSAASFYSPIPTVPRLTRRSSTSRGHDRSLPSSQDGDHLPEFDSRFRTKRPSSALHEITATKQSRSHSCRCPDNDATTDSLTST